MAIATICGGIFFAGGMYEHFGNKVEMVKRDVEVTEERSKRAVEVAEERAKRDNEVARRENLERLFRVMNEAEYESNRPKPKAVKVDVE